MDRLPRRTPAAPATLWWLGAHGGAGETTLAEMLPGSRAADHCWPTDQTTNETTDQTSTEATGQATGRGRLLARPVVLVCRSHARGLHAAQRALTDWASGAVPGVDLLGLVIVADAPQSTPKPLRDLAQLVAGGAPRVWHLPWIEALRYAPTPAKTPRAAASRTSAPSGTESSSSVPAAARDLLRELTRLTPTTQTVTQPSTQTSTQPALQTAVPAVTHREDS